MSASNEVMLFPCVGNDCRTGMAGCRIGGVDVKVGGRIAAIPGAPCALGDVGAGATGLAVLELAVEGFVHPGGARSSAMSKPVF